MNLNLETKTRIEILKQFAGFSARTRGLDHYYVKNGWALATNGHALLKARLKDHPDGIYNFDDHKDYTEAFKEKEIKMSYELIEQFIPAQQHLDTASEFNINLPIYPAMLPDPIPETEVPIFLPVDILKNGIVALKDNVPETLKDQIMFRLNIGYLLCLHPYPIKIKIIGERAPALFSVDEEIYGCVMGIVFSEDAAKSLEQKEAV
ncbi:MAG: hypothetical protein ACXVCY_04395 [Pseudobdellovibrionaceae bacterium]